MKIEATIYFKMLPTHPDYGCVENPTEEMSITDTYDFDEDIYSFHDAKNLIRRDLGLVAGGGYNSKHVTETHFNFKRIK